MKKISVFKWLAITAIFCVVVFSACKHEPAPQKKIVVTGIPATHNGRIGVTSLGTSGGDLVAISAPVPINGGTVNTTLYEGDTFSVPFTGSGTYMVLLLIYDSTLSTVLWQGAIFSKSITVETTTISFNEFINWSSSVQQTPLGVRNAFQGILKELGK